MFGLALDIGYSNVKMKFGLLNEKPRTEITPIGAGPCSEIAHEDFEQEVREGVVYIDGEMWVGGVDPELFDGDRTMMRNYYTTHQFNANLKTALLKCGVTTIDILTIGLPVAQYKCTETKQGLEAALLGEHKIGANLTVKIKTVNIQSQAVAAYHSFYDRYAEDLSIVTAIENGIVLICDSGFFSFNWVTMDRGDFKIRSSGSDTHAMSAVLEEAVRIIRRDHNRRKAIEDIETLLRKGKKTIWLNQVAIDLDPILQEAAQSVGRKAIEEVAKSLRFYRGLSGGGSARGVDIVSVAGGAARYYEPQLKEAFPEAIFLELENPEMANVDGFWISTVQEGEKLEGTASRTRRDQRKINVRINRNANNFLWQIMDELDWDRTLCAAKIRELATIGAMVQAGGTLGHTAFGVSQESSLDQRSTASRPQKRE